MRQNAADAVRAHRLKLRHIVIAVLLNTEKDKKCGQEMQVCKSAKPCTGRYYHSQPASTLSICNSPATLSRISFTRSELSEPCDWRGKNARVCVRERMRKSAW